MVDPLASKLPGMVAAFAVLARGHAVTSSRSTVRATAGVVEDGPAEGGRTPPGQGWLAAAEGSCAERRSGGVPPARTTFVGKVNERR
jgi:hypothetical protein